MNKSSSFYSAIAVRSAPDSKVMDGRSDNIKKYNLPRRLAVMAALITLPFLVHTLWIYSDKLARDHAESEENVSVMARLLAADVSQTLLNTRQLLKLFAATVDHAAPLHTLCEPLLRRMLEQQPYYLQAVVAKPDGEIVCGANPVPKGATIADREYFQRAMSAQSFTTSGLIHSRTTGKPTIAAGYPIIGPAGHVRGALAISINLDWLQNLFERIQLPEDMVALLVEGTGTIIFRYPPLEGITGKLVPDVDTFLKATSTQAEGIVRVVGHDAVDRVVAFSRLEGDTRSPMYIRTGIARESIEAHARSILISGLTIFAIVLLIAGTFAWFAARNLVIEPVRMLIRISRRMGIHDLGARTGIASDNGEIGQLAGAFDSMAGRLQRSVRALQALSAGNRTIIRCQNEQELLDAMCVVAVEKGGYPLAMVHYALPDDGKTLALRAQAGNNKDYASGLVLTWADAPRGRGPAGTAVRSGRMDVIRDITTSDRFSPWRDMAAERGFKSFISFPLRVAGSVIGAFTLAATDSEAFDED
jgi:HAMP domain-containing protein